MLDLPCTIDQTLKSTLGNKFTKIWMNLILHKLDISSRVCDVSVCIFYKLVFFSPSVDAFKHEDGRRNGNYNKGSSISLYFSFYIRPIFMTLSVRLVQITRGLSGSVH